jgi:POT family proton-dependent oligopeptide transporter
MLKNHPKGLMILFFTEMWERFGYYLILGIFFLYMTDTDRGGLGFGNAKAADILGTYLALVYLTPFLGGLLADRILGYSRAIILGGFLMAAGYIGLAIPGDTLFWISLLLIIAGNGFFKPNISTLVGNLYTEEKYKKSKDLGYNIFYMGINVGAFVCNFVAAYLRNYYGWGYAFGAAGIGMIFGVIWFMSGRKNISYADVIKPIQAEDMSLARIFGLVFGPLLVFGAIGWFIPGNIFGSDSNDAFLFAAVPVAVFYISLWVRASKTDKAPIAALLSIFGVVIIFWAIFHQNASALTIWARDYTDRSMPAVVEPLAQTFGMVQIVDTSPREVPKLDAHGVPIVDAQGLAVTETGPDPYFNNLDRSVWADQQGVVSLKLISTEIFQSVNPGFVVLLTPFVVAFFVFLRKRGREPSTPAKIGWGMFITALSTLVMIGAVVASQNGLEKSSPSWLIASYGVITVGELFLSPMGLSMVSKLSPPRITSLLMGGWFVSISIGNKLSGIIAGMWDSIAGKEYFFLINFAGAMIGAAMIFLMVKWLARVMVEHTSSR